MEVDLKIYGYSKEILKLREKKVSVRPIHRDGGWVASNHDSSFLNDGAVRDYTVPSKARGRVLVNPCPDFVQDKKTNIDDWQALADELGLESVRDLNPNTIKGFWMREAESTVKMDKRGKYLNLNDTRDFVEFLVLRSNSHLIAHSWATRFDSGEFMFALVEDGEEIIDQVSNLEQEKKAFAYLDQIDSSTEKMTDFLYVFYLTKKEAKKPPRNGTVDWLKAEVGKIIKSDLNIFLGILDDPDYNLKLLIQRSVDSGALHKDKHRYTFPGADAPVGNLEDLIAFLDDEKNQTERMKLMKMVEEKMATA